MNAGDNIVIREWGDASHTWEGEGVWVVTSTPDADSVICKRRTQLDKNPSNNNFLQTMVIEMVMKVKYVIGLIITTLAKKVKIIYIE